MIVTRFKRWDSFLRRVRVRVLGSFFFFILTSGLAGIFCVILNDLYIFPRPLERHILKSKEINRINNRIYVKFFNWRVFLRIHLTYFGLETVIKG